MILYLAAPLSEARRACRIAELLAAHGHDWCSRWHRDVVLSGATADPGDDEAERARILAMNLEDIAKADALVVLLDRGTGRSTYAEIGYALALDKPVVWVSGPFGYGRSLFDAHPLVARVVTDVIEPGSHAAMVREIALALGACLGWRAAE